MPTPYILQNIVAHPVPDPVFSAVRKLGCDLFPADIAFYHEHCHMIEQIRDLIFELLMARVLRRDDHLGSLFTSFFKDLVYSLVK